MRTRPEPVDLLRVVATRYRGRVTTLNLYDPNVCTSAIDWRDALENRPPPPDHFRHQLKLKLGGRSIGVRSNDRLIAIDAKGTFGSEVPFSINRPDRVMMCATHLARQMGARNWRVFVQIGKNVPSTLDQNTIRHAIETLGLGADESLHVYANGLTVYIRPDSVARVVDAIAATVAIADALPSIKISSLAIDDCPKEFGALKPLFERWAKSDDQERTDLLARASPSRLEGLVTRVKPYFTAINAYLDSFGDGPMPEFAMALGSLAECASEAQLLLGKKTRTKAVSNRRLQPTAARRVSRKRANRRG
jgi:hypothetical protein